GAARGAALGGEGLGGLGGVGEARVLGHGRMVREEVVSDRARRVRHYLPPRWSAVRWGSADGGREWHPAENPVGWVRVGSVAEVRMAAVLTVRDETTGGAVSEPITLEFPTETITVRELIRERVYQEVQDYNRTKAGAFRGLVQPTEAEVALNG